MTSIVKATIQDYQLISDIGKTTFVESHGHSATKEVINEYVQEKFNLNAVKDELSSPENIYRIIFYRNQPAGYSKIILNSGHPAISTAEVTKLERIYLLKEFYKLKFGSMLFDHNLDLSKSQHQNGMWLFTWKENNRAIEFYQKKGFNIIGSYEFKLTETHSNPNYLMFLEY